MGTTNSLFRQTIQSSKAVGKGTFITLPPPNLPEVAFIGRSNVGKSTLINALVGQKSLARTSSSPGHTRAIHFFEVGHHFALVDLPGYGFAKMAQKLAKNLSARVRFYISRRPTLKCVYVLVDARRGLKDVDIEMLTALHTEGVRGQVVLTKTDHLKTTELEKAQKAITQSLKERFGKAASTLCTAAPKGIGIEDLQNHILTICQVKS